MDTETAAEYEYVEMPAHKVNVGTAYNKGKCEKRKAVLYASRGKKCKFVDSHMHLDTLQTVSRMQDLDMIMREGPMPSMPVELEAAIMNYCHGLPADLAKHLFLEDYHLFYCYGIHPKLAHTVPQKDKRAVMSKVNFDSRRVGVGEMGIDLSGDFEKTLSNQTRCSKIFFMNTNPALCINMCWLFIVGTNQAPPRPVTYAWR